MKKQSSFTCLLLVGFLSVQAQLNTAITAKMQTRTYSTAVKKPVSRSMQLKFHEDYPGVYDDIWSPVKNGYLVSFSCGDIQYQLILDQKDKTTSETRYYAENYLADGVRKIVKENYPCISIFSVQEITANRTKTFLVTLDDGIEWKVLRIFGTEVELIKRFKKG